MMVMLNGTELKASTVLQSMVSGLLKSKDDPNFIVKMESLGYVKNNLCFGCCATLTLAEMFGEGKLTSEMMLAYVKAEEAEEIDKLKNLEDLANYARIGREVYLSNVIKFDPSIPQDSLLIDKLYDLEKAVNNARVGYVLSLIEFLTGEANKSFDGRWFLDDWDWEEQIPKVERTIAEMAAAGY